MSVPDRCLRTADRLYALHAVLGCFVWAVAVLVWVFGRGRLLLMLTYGAVPSLPILILALPLFLGVAGLFAAVLVASVPRVRGDRLAAALILLWIVAALLLADHLFRPIEGLVIPDALAGGAVLGQATLSVGAGLWWFLYGRDRLGPPR
ncbi:MAG: hypothetical protein AB1486_24265 [Planctomycetota bacterium]